uniref:Uncharacterized protein n=1 Tax=Anguilla anguilla TaxID=7936 RepID=A0A0E9WLH0_ANGAN
MLFKYSFIFFGYCTLLSLLWPWLSLLASVCKTTECRGDFMFSAFLLSIKIMLIIIMIIIIIVCCFFYTCIYWC